MKYGSMAASAGKAFNKNSTRGGGGFGTSTRRPEVPGAAGTPRREETPGPGAYDDAERRKAATPRAASPSAAFASRSGQHDSHVRRSESPAVSSYDAYTGSSMA